MLETIRSDIRYALRWLRRSPGFTLVAVASLAIGIGFNTALFTLVDALLFRPLPVDRPERLVDVFTTGGDGDRYATSSYPDLLDFRAQNHVFGDMLAYSPSLAAVKPTVGRISRYGVIPITADQDTPGPMARSVTDAAILLGVLEGQPDPNDPATTRCTPPPNHDYRQFLKADGLKGARIGIPRANYYDKTTPPGADKPRGGLNDDQAKVMAQAIDALKQAGAVIVDPSDIPSVVDKDANNNLLLWSICSDMD